MKNYIMIRIGKKFKGYATNITKLRNASPSKKLPPPPTMTNLRAKVRILGATAKEPIAGVIIVVVVG